MLFKIEKYHKQSSIDHTLELPTFSRAVKAFENVIDCMKNLSLAVLKKFPLVRLRFLYLKPL